ncbi:MAG: hypothetical protein HFH47_03760 [Bacilli bacterium]|nr:hypothetical protein [Bacilli bacterium]
MKRYICEKENKDMVSCDFDFTAVDGFKVKPKNKVKYDGIEVNKLTIISPYFIDNVLKRKTKRKLNSYLQFLFNSLEDDDTSGDDLGLILEDTKRYKALIINKYSKFLDVNYIRELLFRVTFIEEELKMRIRMEHKSFNQAMGRGR